MMKSLYIVVFLMALVTYIPRLLPMVLLKDMKLSPSFKVFLQFIPFAALGALIFPGVLTSTGDMPSAAAGGIFAVILALSKANIMIVVLGGILGAYLWTVLI